MRWCWTGSSRSRPASINKSEERGKSGVATFWRQQVGWCVRRPARYLPAAYLPPAPTLPRTLQPESQDINYSGRFISIHGCLLTWVAMDGWLRDGSRSYLLPL
jgi:hypothetical protein